MPLILPNLDDRSFEQLRLDALDEIKKNLDTDWSDLTPGDPGVVLLEAFAFLTEQLIYRLNLLPEKVYIAFLRLLGVSINPPTAAQARLKFWIPPEALPAGLDENWEVHLPLGTQVTTSAGGGSETAPVFVTAKEVRLTAANSSEETAAEVMAVNAEWVEEGGG
ncbi:MAG TPA: hypothetical protein VF498_12685 [Anaerolineales bacterium]